MYACASGAIVSNCSGRDVEVEVRGQFPKQCAFGYVRASEDSPTVNRALVDMGWCCQHGTIVLATLIFPILSSRGPLLGLQLWILDYWRLPRQLLDEKECGHVRVWHSGLFGWFAHGNKIPYSGVTIKVE